MSWLDHWILVILAPMALWILISGLDDLFITVVFFCPRRSRFRWPTPEELDHSPERRIAILVPLWREQGVIGQMLDHNLAALRYHNYDVFVGVYPNDEPTVRAVADAAARHPRVHLAMGSHNGPTSKGDNLNSVYTSLRRFEETARLPLRSDHDARRRGPDPSRFPAHDQLAREGLRHGAGAGAGPAHGDPRVHPRVVLRRIRRVSAEGYSGAAAPGRIPALQRRRAPASKRARWSGWRPPRNGRIFDPECLTEDYENGYWPARPGLPANLCAAAVFAGGPAGHPGVFSAPLAGRRPPAQPVGGGHRPARLGAARLARALETDATGSGAIAKAWWAACSPRSPT